MPQAKPDFQTVYPERAEGRHVPLEFTRLSEGEMLERAEAFYRDLSRRRSVRQFSSEPVPRRLIELAILAAGTAPSGAHHQPWQYVAVSSPDLKARIRAAAEAEEYATYTRRMAEEWKDALAPIGTTWVKEHLTDAPWLVVIFKQNYQVLPGGSHKKNYYVQESVGISAGMFIAALHRMGLTTLTHTPTPMGFLRELLGRGENETAMLLLPVGYPAQGATVPDFRRKGLEEISSWL
ncbi:MAG: nitroreductase family protein [Meiothermus sp.]|nr:nitroreductase family protein [Meiothermus sp.]